MYISARIPNLIAGGIDATGISVYTNRMNFL